MRISEATALRLSALAISLITVAIFIAGCIESEITSPPNDPWIGPWRGLIDQSFPPYRKNTGRIFFNLDANNTITGTVTFKVGHADANGSYNAVSNKSYTCDISGRADGEHFTLDIYRNIADVECGQPITGTIVGKFNYAINATGIVEAQTVFYYTELGQSYCLEGDIGAQTQFSASFQGNTQE